MKTKYDQKNLRKVFKKLNKLGFVAQRHFWCCRTCAMEDLKQIRRDIISDVENDCEEEFGYVDESIEFLPLPYVFLTDQDEEDLKKDGACWISYGVLSGGYIEEKIETERILKTFKEFGVKIEWDGDFNKRMRIFIN